MFLGRGEGSAELRSFGHLQGGQGRTIGRRLPWRGSGGREKRQAGVRVQREASDCGKGAVSAGSSHDNRPVVTSLSMRFRAGWRDEGGRCDGDRAVRVSGFPRGWRRTKHPGPISKNSGTAAGARSAIAVARAGSDEAGDRVASSGRSGLAGRTGPRRCREIVPSEGEAAGAGAVGERRSVPPDAAASGGVGWRACPSATIRQARYLPVGRRRQPSALFVTAGGGAMAGFRSGRRARTAMRRAPRLGKFGPPRTRGPTWLSGRGSSVSPLRAGTAAIRSNASSQACRRCNRP